MLKSAEAPVERVRHLLKLFGPVAGVFNGEPREGTASRLHSDAPIRRCRGTTPFHLHRPEYTTLRIVKRLAAKYGSRAAVLALPTESSRRAGRPMNHLAGRADQRIISQGGQSNDASGGVSRGVRGRALET